MRLKTPLLVVAVLAVLAALAAWLGRTPADPAPDPLVGRALAPEDLLRATTRISLHGADGAAPVHLVRTDAGVWMLAGDPALPADFAKLARFARELGETRIERFITRNPERLARLDLGRARISLADAAGTQLAAWDIGRNADSGGVYLRPAGGDAAYLSDRHLYLDNQPANWTRKQVLELDPADIRTCVVACADGDSLRFSRAQPDAPFQLDETGSVTDEFDRERLDRWLDNLLRLRFTRTAERAEPDAVDALAHARTHQVTTFAGHSHSIAIGRRPAQPAPAATEDADAPPAAAQPAGPVYAFYTTPAGDIWEAGAKAYAFALSDFQFDQQPAREELLPAGPSGEPVDAEVADPADYAPAP